MPTKSEFSIEFQRIILRQSVANPDWYKKFHSSVVPAYFDSTELRYIAEIVHEFYSKHGTVPVRSVLTDLIKTKYDGEMRRMVLEELPKIGQSPHDQPTIEYITEKVTIFEQQHRYRNAIVQAASSLEAGDMESVDRVLADATVRTESSVNHEIDYFDISDVNVRADRTHDLSVRIPTLWRSLDQQLHGGPSRGELAVLMAPPNRGKSIGLVNIGTNAMFTGHNVLHVTNELSARKTSYRYDSRLTGMTYNEIEHNPKRFKEKIGRFRSMYKGNLRIKQYPARAATVQDLSNDIRTLARQGFIADMLVLDYADELKHQRGDNSNEVVGQLFSELRALAMEQDKLIWTATQTTRGSFSKVRLDMDDVADSWNKMKVSDLVVAICQTTEEYDQAKMRLITVKNRDNQRFNKPIHMHTELGRMLITENEK